MQITPLRITKKHACTLLSISPSYIEKLIKNDLNFPRPIKDGTTRQSSVHFDTQEIVKWHTAQVEASKTAA